MLNALGAGRLMCDVGPLRPMVKESTLGLCIFAYLCTYFSLVLTTFSQVKRLTEWFIQWRPQDALRDVPMHGPGKVTYFLTKRAAQMFRPHAFLWRQWLRLVLLVIATLLLALAWPVIGLIMIIRDVKLIP
jgi:hypothetical protein